MITLPRSVAMLVIVTLVHFIDIGDSFTWQTELSIRSVISTVTVITILSISTCRCAILASLCEITALVYNCILAVAYSINMSSVDKWYPDVMDALFLIQVAAISIGMFLNDLGRLQHRSKYLGDSGNVDSSLNVYTGEAK